jgi:hypothetical protein
MLNTCVETVIAGAQQIIEAAADAVEGATKIVVDAAAFGRDVVASITSFGTNIGGILFGGAPGAGVSVPYRTSSVATLSDPAEDDQILTLVGRVHAVSVSDSAGPITSFPPGAVTFVTTVLESQVTGAGLPAEALAQVSVYRFDPGSMTWDELETTRTSGDGQVTLTAALSQPGEYAPGVTRLRSEPAPPEVVSVRPVCREIVPGPEVTLSAVVHSDSGMDPESVTVLLDRQPVTGIVTSLSPGGTYLHLSAVATLAPGAHRMVVAAADLSGRLAAASITFYVDRENTFPDVPPDFWAWRYVEAAKLAGIVQGYWDGYRPAELVNRAQMAVYIARGIAGGDALVPTAPATATFPDVPVDHWAFKYVEYCYEEAVVQGYWDGYHPVEIVNRAQMAVYVARALVAPSGDSAVPDPAPPATFPDVPATHWAYKWIEYCHDQEVVQGYWDGYHPDEAVNRAQMAVYVQRAFQLPM